MNLSTAEIAQVLAENFEAIPGAWPEAAITILQAFPKGACLGFGGKRMCFGGFSKSWHAALLFTVCLTYPRSVNRRQENSKRKDDNFEEETEEEVGKESQIMVWLWPSEQ